MVLKEQEDAVALLQEAIAHDPQTVLWKDGLATEAKNLAVVRLKLGDGAGGLSAATVSRNAALASIKSEGARQQMGTPIAASGAAVWAGIGSRGSPCRSAGGFRRHLGFL